MKSLQPRRFFNGYASRIFLGIPIVYADIWPTRFSVDFVKASRVGSSQYNASKMESTP